MKSSAFYLVVLTLFIVGLFASAYFLYSLPVLFEEGSYAVTPEVINELAPVFLKLNVSVGITLLLGVYCIFNLSARNKKKNVVEKIVYIDKAEEQKGKTKESRETDKEQEEKLKAIENAVQQKRTFNNKCEALINTLCQKIEASQGIFYQVVKNGSKRQIQMVATYAYSLPDSQSLTFEFGEGLAGQSAKEGKTMKIDEVPDGYISIVSGLGAASPNHLLIKPVMVNDEVVAVAELASFKEFTAGDENVIEKSIALVQNEVAKANDKKPEEKPDKKQEGSSKKGK